ncbi:MAG: transposase [bacterium]
MLKSQHLGFYKHDYLPHYDQAGLIQFVTFVLDDAAPRERLRTGMRMSNQDGERMFFRIDADLDRNRGSCLLARNEIGNVVAEEISQLGEQLIAWVVMPNHVHLLFRQPEGEMLGKTIQRIKSRSSMIINRSLGREGKLWQAGYFDRCMRDLEHVQNTIEYIHYNPVKAGLAITQLNWELSSARTFCVARAMEIIARTFHTESE